MHKLVFISLIFFSGVFLKIEGQNSTFKITNRNASTYTVPNNATFFQTSVPLGKVQNDFDVINLTNSNQEIIIKKTDLLLNVISATDKALPSYCFGIFCRNADVYTDTVPFLPSQTIPLEFDFFEASYPGHSWIKYVIYNKNNMNESMTIFVDYLGIVGINKTNSLASSNFQLFPNPSDGLFNLIIDSKSLLNNSKIIVRDFLGKIVHEAVVDVMLPNESIQLRLGALSKGLYQLQVENQNQNLFRQLIVIE